MLAENLKKKFLNEKENINKIKLYLVVKLVSNFYTKNNKNNLFEFLKQ